MNNMYDDQTMINLRKRARKNNIILIAVLAVIAIIIIAFVLGNRSAPYVGSWKAYAYKDRLNINEDGTYSHTWRDGNYTDRLESGRYMVFDDLDDIPDYLDKLDNKAMSFRYRVESRYGDMDVTWIVLLSSDGMIYEYGYYRPEDDEIIMGIYYERQ